MAAFLEGKLTPNKSPLPTGLRWISLSGTALWIA